MAFSRLNTDLDIIAKLSDDPNTTDGLTSNQLKAKFDQGANSVKSWINSVFLAALEGITAAANIGAKLTGFSSITTVQGALDQLLTIANQASQASIPDNSITQVKLATVDNTELNGAVGTNNINKQSVTHTKLAVVDSNGENGAVDTNNINDGAITATKLAPGAVSGSVLTQNSVTNDALDSGDAEASPPRPAAVSTDKIQAEAVTGPKIAANAVSTVYSGTLLPTSWTTTPGSTRVYQAVTISGILASDEPIIDLAIDSSGSFTDAVKRDNEWGYIYRAATSADTITFYARQMPTIDLPFRARCIRK